MKNLIIILTLIFSICASSYAAEPVTVTTPATTSTHNYLLYPTANIYTFLKLDTRNGKIWQVQYAMDENEFEVVLNGQALTTIGKAGQFALYPTTNNWTFILLDTVYGDVWHVQWSQDASKRGIIPIRPL